jgi:PAS domain S-box-containing protein
MPMPEPLSVLLVEDSPADARLLRELLRTTPAVRVAWVETLAAALARLAEPGVDLVLLDLGLPDSRDLDAVARIARAHPALPIVVLTGRDDDALALAALTSGAQDYLVKGAIEPGVLIRCLRYAVERKRAEGEREALLWQLETERARWQTTVDSLPDPVTTCDAAGRATYMNAAYSQLIGRTIEAGLPLESHAAHYDLYHADGRPFESQELPLQKAALTGEAVRNVELIQRSSSGEEVVLRVNASPLRDTGGRVTGAVAVCRDTTTERRAQDALRESEERLRLALQAARAGAWRWDIATGAMDWSEEYYALLGREPGACPPSYALWIEQVHPDDRDRVAASMQRTLQEHQEFHLDFRIRRADGTIRWVSRRGRVLSAPGGQPARAIGITFDITDVKETEFALRGALATLEARLLERSGAPALGPPEDPEAGLPREIGVLGKDLGRRATELVALDRVAEVLASSLDLRATLPRLLAEVRELLDAEAAGVILHDAAHEALTIAATDGEAIEPIQGLRHSLEGTLTGRVLRTRQAIMVNDVAQDPQVPDSFRALTGGRIRSMILVPAVCKGQALGILALLNKRTGLFLPHHLRTLSLIANTAAVAIDNGRLFEEAQRSRARLERVSGRLVEVQEAERRAIARELHDEIGQALTGLKLLLATGAAGAEVLGAERRAEAQALVANLLGRVRELSLDLRPAVLDDLGLLAALLWHSDRFTRQTGIAVRLQHLGMEGRRFPTAVEIAVFRVVQEALTNVARHAAAPEATVRLWADAEVLGVTVEDQGRGFDVEAALSAHQSTGLSAMQERVRLLGGRFRPESRPGSGTRITAEFLLIAAAPPPERAP